MSEWRLSPKLKENVFRKKFNISFSLQTQPARRWGGSDWLFSLPLRHSLCSILRTVEVSGICNSVTSLGRTAKEFEDASEIEKNKFMDISRRRVDGLIKSMTAGWRGLVARMGDAITDTLQAFLRKSLAWVATKFAGINVRFKNTHEKCGNTFYAPYSSFLRQCYCFPDNWTRFP